MTTVRYKWELKDCTEQYVLVKSEDNIYQCVDGEYIKKLKFSVDESVDILKTERSMVYKLCGKLGVQAVANKNKKLRISLSQLRQMAKMV